MKKTLIAAGLSALTLIAAGAATAQTAAERPAPKADLQRSELVSRLDARFAKLDVDKDGSISAADRKALRDARIEKRFKRLDADGNGAVTLAEMQAAHDKRAERAPEGAAKHKMHRGKRGHGGRHHFGAMGGKQDTDGDGLISRDEFRAPALAWFDKADADRNGVLTAAERKAARDAMRTRREAK